MIRRLWRHITLPKWKQRMTTQHKTIKQNTKQHLTKVFLFVFLSQKVFFFSHLIFDRKVKYLYWPYGNIDVFLFAGLVNINLLTYLGGIGVPWLACSFNAARREGRGFVRQQRQIDSAHWGSEWVSGDVLQLRPAQLLQEKFAGSGTTFTHGRVFSHGGSTVVSLNSSSPPRQVTWLISDMPSDHNITQVCLSSSSSSSFSFSPPQGSDDLLRCVHVLWVPGH